MERKQALQKKRIKRVEKSKSWHPSCLSYAMLWFLLKKKGLFLMSTALSAMAALFCLPEKALEVHSKLAYTAVKNRNV